MTHADFDSFNATGGGLLAAWDAEPGHHVVFVIPEPSSIMLLLATFACCLSARCDRYAKSNLGGLKNGGTPKVFGTWVQERTSHPALCGTSLRYEGRGWSAATSERLRRSPLRVDHALRQGAHAC